MMLLPLKCDEGMYRRESLSIARDYPHLPAVSRSCAIYVIAPRFAAMTVVAGTCCASMKPGM